MPQLDQMAREGFRYTSQYSGHNICSPSRSALMFGKHMGHTSVTGNSGRLRADDSRSHAVKTTTTTRTA